jgi:hypothetical protein
VLLLSGDHKGYRNVRARLLSRFGKAPRLRLRAYHLARTWTLAPCSVEEGMRAVKLAARELNEHGTEYWSQTELAALQYRLGLFEDAVNRLHLSLRPDASPGSAVLNWLWLALAHQRLGETEEARRWLDRAVLWLDRFPRGMPARAEQGLGLHLHNWLEAHILRREAEALMGAAASVSRQGEPERSDGTGKFLVSQERNRNQKASPVGDSRAGR